jgi:hypothetical protein
MTCSLGMTAPNDAWSSMRPTHRHAEPSDGRLKHLAAAESPRGRRYPVEMALTKQVGHTLAVQRPDGNAHGGPSPTSDLAAMPPDASPWVVRCGGT